MPYSTPEKRKEYLERTKEVRAEYKKQYDQDTKEERNAKTDCGCGGIFALKHRAKHYRTDKHQAYEALAKLELTEN